MKYAPTLYVKLQTKKRVKRRRYYSGTFFGKIYHFLTAVVLFAFFQRNRNKWALQQDDFPFYKFESRVISPFLFNRTLFPFTNMHPFTIFNEMLHFEYCYSAHKMLLSVFDFLFRRCHHAYLGPQGRCAPKYA